ncbi:MAG: SET domain-containing protein-lysine N-methyltransferase [Polyangiales bacterium]
MLHIKTTLGTSRIEGIGLFAATSVRKGTLIWAFVPTFDRMFSAAEIALLPEHPRAFIVRYTWREGDSHFLCVDDTRFMNHSRNANVVSIEDPAQPLGVSLVAARDIAAGEELTSDYSIHDQDFASYQDSLRP